MPLDIGYGVTLLVRAETSVTYAGRSRMPFPVSIDTVHHSVTPPQQNPLDDARLLQQAGINAGHRGMSYSYAICRDGTIIEGQGEFIGAHTLGFNTRGFGVCFIGNYNDLELTAQQINSYHALREWRISNGWLTLGIYPTWDHQGSGFPTACAGNNIRARMAELRATNSPIVEDDMQVFINTDPEPGGGQPWHVTDGLTKRRLKEGENQLLKDLGLVASATEVKYVSRPSFDRIPNAGEPTAKQIADAVRDVIPAGQGIDPNAIANAVVLKLPKSGTWLSDPS